VTSSSIRPGRGTAAGSASPSSPAPEGPEDGTATAGPRRRPSAWKYLLVFLAPIVAVIVAVSWVAYDHDTVAVAAVHPGAADAARCSALHKALPSTLLGQDSRRTSPSSDTTAAWGKPPVVLRCGVGTPAVLDPKSATYDPTAQAEDINGVCWVDEKAADGATRFTTVKQRTYVEVTVPSAYSQGNSPLPALTSAIEHADPADPSRSLDCA